MGVGDRAEGALRPRPGSVSRADLQRLAQFRTALRRFLRFSEVRARAAGVTPQQYQLLLSIMAQSDRDWATLTEIAAALQVNHNAVVGLVQRAEQAGLVCRTAHPTDRRHVRVGLSSRGWEILLALAGEHKQELERLAPVLGAVINVADPSQE